MLQATQQRKEAAKARLSVLKSSASIHQEKHRVEQDAALANLLELFTEKLSNARKHLKTLKDSNDGYDTESSEAAEAKAAVALWKEKKAGAFVALQGHGSVGNGARQSKKVPAKKPAPVEDLTVLDESSSDEALELEMGPTFASMQKENGDGNVPSEKSPDKKRQRFQTGSDSDDSDDSD